MIKVSELMQIQIYFLDWRICAICVRVGVDGCAKAFAGASMI